MAALLSRPACAVRDTTGRNHAGSADGPRDRPQARGGFSMKDEAVIEELVTCRVCKVEKPTSEMAKDRRKPKGYILKCAACKQLVSDAYRKSNHQKELERCRAGRIQRPEQEIERSRRYHREHPDIRRAQGRARAGTDKVRAREALRYAVQSGRIAKPSTCQDCGRTDLQLHGHHHDYTKPFDVTWLCSRCHGKRHRLPDVEQAG